MLTVNNKPAFLVSLSAKKIFTKLIMSSGLFFLQEIYSQNTFSWKISSLKTKRSKEINV